MYKVCAISTTRADYGILKPLLVLLNEHPKMRLQFIVSGTHLSHDYGHTIDQIMMDKLPISASVEILSNDTTQWGIIKTMSNAQIAIGDILNKLQSDIVIVLGDRYELLPIVTSCVVLNIPVCHLHGGEITQGAIDEQFRHAITKMSTLHFCASDEYARRIIQMGEQPRFVHNVGSLAVEQIKKLELMSQKAISKELTFDVNDKTLLVTFHPITLERESQHEQMNEMLSALDDLIEYNVIFTRPNADAMRSDLNMLIDMFVSRNPHRSKAFDSLGQLKYFSVLSLCYGVVGNSSSGIIEAPSFKIPTINVGNRQKGRMASTSVIHVDAKKKQILQAFEYIKTAEYQDILVNCHNPYEKNNSAELIIEHLCNHLENDFLKMKEFYDLKA